MKKLTLTRKEWDEIWKKADTEMYVPEWKKKVMKLVNATLNRKQKEGRKGK